MLYIAKGAQHRFTRNELFQALKARGDIRPTSKESQNALVEFVNSFINTDLLTNSEKKQLKSTLQGFGVVLYRKWKKSGRSILKFTKANTAWLNQALIITGCKTSGGRPKVPFSIASLKTKQRIIKPLIESRSKEELALATEMSYRASGSKDTALMFKKISDMPSQSTKIKQTLEQRAIPVENGQFSPEEALALFFDLKLSQAQYQLLRNSLKKKGLKNVLPSYHRIVLAKKDCYPSNLSVSEKKSEVCLQSLVDHTAKRLVDVQKEVFSSFAFECNENPLNLKLFFKWGVDGSGGKTSYKQPYHSEVFDDTSIVTTSIVPLRLIFENNNQSIVFWKNPRLSSTRYCRPLRLQYAKENDEFIKNEFEKVENEIKELNPIQILIDEKQIIIHYTMYSTMVDGKVCNALMGSSSQKCYICKAGPKEFNILENAKFQNFDTAALNFGLSPLHAYIRSFECFLHIAYRLDFATWRTTKELKPLYENRKKKIIEDFRKKNGLLVDVPKQGFGSSNDGNTARRFFQDPQLSSEITGINENLIYRFGVLLRALNSDFQINTEHFETYALETAKIYVSLYPWFPMPPSIHKILLHSTAIIKHFLLPIGQLSEDAQEARHKEVKAFREHTTRKISRTKTMEDLFNVLLATSDPFLSSLRNLPSKNQNIFSEDIRFLLKCEIDNQDMS